VVVVIVKAVVSGIEYTAVRVIIEILIVIRDRDDCAFAFSKGEVRNSTACKDAHIN
jgi:hypothetical protein